MPGMNSGLNPADPTVVAAFRSALLHQGLIALGILVVLLLIWGTAQAWAPALGRGGAAAGGQAAGDAAGPARGARPGVGSEPEPSWRRVLRIGFGLLWILDGFLQAQPKMPAGLPAQVIQPTAASSPAWVQHLVNWAGTAWSYHPVQAGAAAVWIQVGIGLWLLVAAVRGRWSRLAGLASVGWGLVVWVFGESFGGIFAPGLTWLFGAPGAVLIYCAAGALIALPERAWRTPGLGRLILAGTGLVLHRDGGAAGMAGARLLAGTSHGQPGTLTGMIQHGQTSQPHFLAGLVTAFGVHRRARVRGQPVRRDRAGRRSARLRDGRPRLATAAVSSPGRAVPGGLGADRGPRLPRRARHRPEQHDPDGAAFAAGYLALVRVPARGGRGRPAPGHRPRPQTPEAEPEPAAPAGPGRPGLARPTFRLAAPALEAAALGQRPGP